MTCCFINDIRKYMSDNNISSNLDTDHPIKEPGIYKINKINKENWIVCMKGPKYTIYKDGVYKIDLKFPKDFPTQRPYIKFPPELRHIQIAKGNGKISVGFLVQWDPNTTISEILVGLFLFFIWDQNPDSPFDSELAHLYRYNRLEFNKKIEESIIKYCSPNLEDLKLIQEMKKYNSCNEAIIKLQNEIKQIKSILSNQNKTNENLISVIIQNESKNIIGTIICKENDNFQDFENSLFKKYPQLKKLKGYFTFNGYSIIKSKSLKENGINDSDIIIIQ